MACQFFNLEIFYLFCMCGEQVRWYSLIFSIKLCHTTPAGSLDFVEPYFHRVSLFGVKNFCEWIRRYITVQFVLTDGGSVFGVLDQNAAMSGAIDGDTNSMQAVELTCTSIRLVKLPWKLPFWSTRVSSLLEKHQTRKHMQQLCQTSLAAFRAAQISQG